VKTNRMGTEISEEMDACIMHVESFFNILLRSEFEDRVVLEIAETGKALVEDMSRRIAEVCGIIEANLGKIEIQRACRPLISYDRGWIGGVKFTPGEVLRRSLQNKELNEGFSIEIQREG